jgi:hypothetical protein
MRSAITLAGIVGGLFNNLAISGSTASTSEGRLGLS